MSGPSPVLWGTPESTGTSCPIPSTTRCVRHVGYVSSHSCSSPRTPLASNFLRRWRWGTLSKFNAFWRSSNMISCWCFWSIPFWICSMVVTKLVCINLVLSGIRAGFRQWRSDECNAALFERIGCVRESCTTVKLARLHDYTRARTHACTHVHTLNKGKTQDRKHILPKQER